MQIGRTDEARDTLLLHMNAFKGTLKRDALRMIAMSYLTDYDERCLSFARDYSREILAIDVNINTVEMLDIAWKLFAKYFKQEEVNIKQALVDKYWNK